MGGIGWAAAAALVVGWWFSLKPAFAWGNEGHRIINRLAATTLPESVPGFFGLRQRWRR